MEIDKSMADECFVWVPSGQKFFNLSQQLLTQF